MTPLHETRSFPDGTCLAITQRAQGLLLRCTAPMPNTTESVVQLTDTTLIARLFDLISALRNLVVADNMGFSCSTMRYVGYFADARQALLATTGENLMPPTPFPDVCVAYDDLLAACAAAEADIDAGASQRAAARLHAAIAAAQTARARDT